MKQDQGATLFRSLDEEKPFMPTCFVIQPFDNDGPYDKRYKDVLVPAIKEAGLEPYRVDEDPGTTILIDDIEKGIRDAEVCLADITTNNPNIWYEVGFALANGKAVVMICLDPRPEPFPFDVRHRHIVNYKLHSLSDFQQLKSAVSTRLKAQAKKAETLQTVAAMSEMQTTEGLSSHEIAVLVTIMSERGSPSSAIVPHAIKNNMRQSGYTYVAIGLALESLNRKAMIEYVEDEDYQGNQFTACRLTARGIDWMLSNQGRFRMTRADKAVSTEVKDDDIPF
jgi:hypothetical protein